MTRLLVAALVMLAIRIPPTLSAEAPPGAASCTGCHAVRSGIDTAIPRLAGRNAAELVSQMEAFRSGQRPATVMDQIAKGFSDAEVQAIAAWYAEQR